MTDDEPEADELRPGDRPSAERGGTQSVEDWTEVPTDPAPEALGYEVAEWERIPTAESEQVIFLPGDEEDLEDDAFVVLQESDLCDLVTER